MSAKASHSSNDGSSNNELAKRVQLFLLAKRAELRRLAVNAEGGIVRLSGRVGTYYLRQLAIAAASHVAGVMRVIDDIEVHDGGGAKFRDGDGQDHSMARDPAMACC